MARIAPSRGFEERDRWSPKFVRNASSTREPTFAPLRKSLDFPPFALARGLLIAGACERRRRGPPFHSYSCWRARSPTIRATEKTGSARVRRCSKATTSARGTTLSVRRRKNRGATRSCRKALISSAAVTTGTRSNPPKTTPPSMTRRTQLGMRALQASEWRWHFTASTARRVRSAPTRVRTLRTTYPFPRLDIDPSTAAIRHRVVASGNGYAVTIAGAMTRVAIARVQSQSSPGSPQQPSASIAFALRELGS